jgi:succinate dehydrogenase hydrophobic anchor subunit
MREKLEDWFYWTGTRIMLIVYMIAAVVIALWLPDWTALVLITIVIAHLYWLKNYEKNYNNKG